MILILLLILNNSSVGHTRAELKSKPTAIPCQNHAILSVDYKLSIILGRRRPEQWRGWDGKVFTNKARWKYAYCIEGRQVEYKCGLLSQYLSMNFATWWCSTALYNVLNDAFQALIAFIVPISYLLDDALLINYHKLYYDIISINYVMCISLLIDEMNKLTKD